MYFQDPSYRIVLSDAQRRAEAEIDFAIDRLFRLAKTLEYEWTEPYQNPVVTPVSSNEPAALENPLFDRFTHLDSLFIARSADECKDYLDALKAWDSKLRRINIVSVRGPNHAGLITAEPISLREEILGFTTTGPNAVATEESIRNFRNFINGQLAENTLNPDNQSLALNFATTIADNRFFPTTGSRWNMRVHGIKIDLFSESGFNTTQVAEIDLIQSGKTALRRFFAEPPIADDLMHLTFNVGDPNRSAFNVTVPAKINGAQGGRPPEEFTALGLKGRRVRLRIVHWLCGIQHVFV